MPREGTRQGQGCLPAQGIATRSRHRVGRQVTVAAWDGAEDRAQWQKVDRLAQGVWADAAASRGENGHPRQLRRSVCVWALDYRALHLTLSLSSASAILWPGSHD